MNWAALINAGAQIGSAYAASKAQGRAAEAQVNQAQDRTAQQSYATDKSLDLNALVNAYEAELKRAQGLLDERAAALKEPSQRASNSVRGDILANVQDVGFSAPPGVNVTTFSGGLRPSLLSGNSRALGQQMSKEALLDALDGGSPKPFSTLKPIDLSSITGRSAPDQTPLPQASGFDRAMEQVGLWGGGAAAVMQALNQPQQPTTASTLAARPLPGGNVSPTLPAIAAQRPPVTTPPYNPYIWNI